MTIEALRSVDPIVWTEKELEKVPGKSGKGNCANVLQMREKGRGENETEL